MDHPHIGEGQERFGFRSLRRRRGLLIYPVRSVGVSLDLHILNQCSIATRNATFQQILHLTLDQRIPFDGSRVMHLPMPYGFPGICCFHRSRETSQMLVELLYLGGQPLVDLKICGTAAPW